MRVVIFGATGMVGRGALHACLLDDAVTGVLAVGRSRTGLVHPKLREIHHNDFTDFSAIAAELTDHDVCMFCLGVPAAGMSENDYRVVTYDYTLAAARALVTANPALTFCYVSGMGTDRSGRSRMMWARVKGDTENALLALTDRAYLFRPATIIPLPGTRAGTRAYVLLYRVLTPLAPVLRRVAPGLVTTAPRVGEAMLAAGRGRLLERTVNTAAINAASRS